MHNAQHEEGFQRCSVVLQSITLMVFCSGQLSHTVKQSIFTDAISIKAMSGEHFLGSAISGEPGVPLYLSH